jgi:hypothetical protein
MFIEQATGLTCGMRKQGVVLKGWFNEVSIAVGLRENDL